ncbi:MAG: AsmA family protein, partial [Pseudomonadales bacterium]
MARLLQALLAITVAAIIALLLLLENPDNYTEQLSSALQSATGYETKLGGTLAWRYWPPVALEAGSLSLAAPGEAPWLEAEGIAIDLNLLALLGRGGQMEINSVEIRSARATFMDGDGDGNSGDSNSSQASQLHIKEFELHSTELDDSRPDHAMETRKPGEPMPSAPMKFSFDATYADQTQQLTDSFTAGGMLRQIGADLQLLNITLSHKLQIEDTDYPPFTNELEGRWFADSGQLQLHRFDTYMDGLTASVPIELDTNEQSFIGKIDSITADLSKLGPALELEAPPGILVANGMIQASAKSLAITVAVQGMGGEMTAELITNRADDLASSADSRLIITAEGVELEQLGNQQGITGKLQAKTELTFQGTHAETLTGSTTFIVTDGKLDTSPIKRLSIAIDAITNKRSSVSDWPDLMPFKRMTGQHNFAEGTRTGQTFNADLDNLAVTGHGGFDLAADTIDYRVTAMLRQTDDSAYKVSEHLAGIRWPMRCRGQITDEVFDLCLGEDGAIADLVAEGVKQSLKRRSRERLQELIEDKVPDKYKDAAENLLKKLLG